MAYSGKSIFGSALGLSTKGNLMSRGYLVPRLVYANNGASSAISNTDAATFFSRFATINPKTLDVGSLLRIRFGGIVTAVDAADTLAIRLVVGATPSVALVSIAATAAAANDTFTGEYELAIRTVGTSGTFVGQGTFKSIPAAEGTMTSKDDFIASTAIDTTVPFFIKVEATWSAAAAGNSCRLDFMRVVQF